MEAGNENTTGCSVIIAAWNAEGFILNSVHSALLQQEMDIEVIVVNDASSDNTRAIVEVASADDERVKLINMQHNSGPSAARNAGIAAATKTWIAILDADDGMSSGRLAELTKVAAQNRADVVFDLFREKNENGEIVSNSLPLEIAAVEQWDLTRWVLDNRPGIGFCTGYLKPLIRRQFLIDQNVRYNEDIRNSEDYLLIEDILLKGGEVWVCPYAGYFYTRRSNSLSYRRDSRQLEALIRLAEETLSNAGNNGTRKALEARLEALLNMRALSKFIEGLQSGSPYSAVRAWYQRPQSTRLLLGWIGEVLEKRVRRQAHV